MSNPKHTGKPTERATPTGVPFVDCTCGVIHPAGRHHCTQCDSPSLFLNTEDVCMICSALEEAPALRYERPQCHHRNHTHRCDAPTFAGPTHTEMRHCTYTKEPL